MWPELVAQINSLYDLYNPDLLREKVRTRTRTLAINTDDHVIVAGQHHQLRRTERGTRGQGVSGGHRADQKAL